MYSAAAICRSTHLPIPQEGRIITSDDVFGHLPDIRCINGGIDAAPAPPLDGAGQCAGLPGVLSEAGGRLPLHPKTRRSRAARYFGLPDKEISSGAVVMRRPAIYNKGSKIREEAHPVAKHLDKFTQPFRDSPIPFALAEILTNGSGEMVDLVCRFLNPAAAALLGLSPEDVQGRRLSQLGPERALEQLAPMQAVAFSGSSASFPYVTAGGQTLTVTCYQVMYGTVACLLDPRSGAGAQSGALPELLPGADLELNREGLRCLACSRQLCQLTQWSRRALLDRGGRAFSALVAPADWPALLPEVLDAAREKRGADHDFRLLRRDGGAVWVNLRAEILSTRQGATVFRGVFLDIDRLRREGQDLQAALSRRETALRDAETLLDRMPVGLCLLRRRPDGGVELLRANQVLSRLLGLSPAALARRLAEDPGSGLPTGEREELLAAAVRSRECGLPLRRACRVCLGGGRELCLSLHMSWVEQPDGSWLAYIACADISQEAAAQAEHQIRSRMYDLLLEHTSLLTLDYDPARDLAQIQRHSTSGRRTSRTVSGYLKSLLTASYLHPEDRRRLAGAVRRAITHPGTVSCTYRADYEDTGWRRYQVSWMSLFDEAGNVYRLLGKAEDVTGRRAAAEHFRQLAARHRRQARACLASARLDLTAGQTLDAKAASRHLLRTLFDRTAGACLQQMASALPEAEERARFQALFSPDALSDAFAEGVFLYRKGRPVLGPDRSRDGGKPGHAASGSLFPAVGPELPQAAKHSAGYLDQAGLRAGPDSGRPLRCLPCLWTIRRPSAGERHLPVSGRLVFPAAAALPPADRPAESPLPGGCLVPAGGSSLCGAGPPGPGRSALPSAVFPAGGDARRAAGDLPPPSGRHAVPRPINAEDPPQAIARGGSSMHDAA